MSDETRPDYRELIPEYLSANVPDLKCPVCGHDGFEIQASPDGDLILHEMQFFYPPTNPLYQGKRAGSAPAAMLVCTRCAHVLLFSWTYILRWRNSK
jgi:hypothetical protein